MKLIFYIFLFSQLLNFLGVFAEKVKEDSSGINHVIWEKVEKNKSKSLKKIIWKSYKGDENYFKLPLPLIDKSNLNFSFSGLKTSVNLIIKKNKIDNDFINNMSASFQKCVSEILCFKIERAIKNLINEKIKLSSISVVGGVANNNYIKSKLLNITNKYKIKLILPPKEMLSDNAAMIAWACIYKYNKKNANIDFKPNPRLTI